VEREVIKAFIADDNDDMSQCDGEGKDTTPSTLYISGSPGTGKTALVNSVLRDFHIPSSELRIVSINCMALNSVDELWVRIVEELGDGEKKGRGKQLKGKEAVLKVLKEMDGRWYVFSSFFSLIFSLRILAS
jgi:cell division control protein 6